MEVGTDDLNDDGKRRARRNWGRESVVGVVEVERRRMRRMRLRGGGGGGGGGANKK